MKNLNLFALSLLSIMLFASCDQLEDLFGDDNHLSEKIENLAFVSNINGYYNSALIKDKDAYICISNNDDYITELLGVFEEDYFISVIFNEEGLPILFESEDVNIRLQYNMDSLDNDCSRIDFFAIIDEQIYTDYTYLYPSGQVKTRSLGDLYEWTRQEITNNINSTIREKVCQFTSFLLTDNAYSKHWNGFLEMVDFLRETDGLNAIELVDYLDDKYNKFKQISEAIKSKESKINKQAPIYYIGITTGGNYVRGNTAYCNIDGFLKVDANGGNFDIDYGICYSESKTPTINDAIKKHTLTNGIISSITVDLPIEMILTGLKENTTYYYRAYFKDNLSGNVMYSENIRNFEIEMSMERARLIELYNSTNGDSWIYKTNWCSEKPLNEWYGIKTNDSGCVTSINLSNNNLTGYAHVDFDDFSSLTSFNIDSNKIREISVRGNDNITELKLTKCAIDNIRFENLKNVTISCETLNSLSGECDVLKVSNCDFGDNHTPFSGIHVKDATIYNCKMHSCGLSSEILTFESSSTYDTWYCNTSKRLNIINSYCSTICGGDFNDGTIINLQNATLWRSNWDEESRVTLTCTITGASWDNLFR